MTVARFKRIVLGSGLTGTDNTDDTITIAASIVGGSELVYRYTIVGSDKADIDTGVDTPDAGSNDWTNGNVLEVFIYARSAAAATLLDAINVVLNNDTGTNYQMQRLDAANTTVSGSSPVGQTSWRQNMAAASAAANVFSLWQITVPNYAGTVGYKTAWSIADLVEGTAANNFLTARTLNYFSTSALTRLKVVSNSAANLKVGSQLLIYKRRAS